MEPNVEEQIRFYEELINKLKENQKEEISMQIDTLQGVIKFQNDEIRRLIYENIRLSEENRNMEKEGTIEKRSYEDRIKTLEEEIVTMKEKVLSAEHALFKKVLLDCKKHLEMEFPKK